MMIDTQAAFELFAAIIRQALIDAAAGDADADFWLYRLGIDRKRAKRPGQATVMPILHPERAAKRHKRALAKKRASQKPAEAFLSSG